MKAAQTEIPMLDKNDAVLAHTLGKIYQIVLKPASATRARRAIDSANLRQLILHLLAAPEHMLPTC